MYYLFSKKSVFVNSSPQQFEASLQMYLEMTYGELAGQDALVAERLGSELVALDPAAIGDPHSFWNDTLGDVSMGVYGDDPEWVRCIVHAPHDRARQGPRRLVRRSRTSPRAGVQIRSR